MATNHHPKPFITEEEAEEEEAPAVDDQPAPEYTRQADIAYERDAGNLPAVNLPTWQGISATRTVPVESKGLVVGEQQEDYEKVEPQSSDIILDPTFDDLDEHALATEPIERFEEQTAERHRRAEVTRQQRAGEPVPEEPWGFSVESVADDEPVLPAEPPIIQAKVTRQDVEPQPFAIALNSGGLSRKLDQVGQDVFVETLNKFIDVLSSGSMINTQTAVVRYFDPPILKSDETDVGKVWHWGIDKAQWRAAITDTDPKTNQPPSSELINSRKRELLWNRLQELGVGQEKHGRNLFENADISDRVGGANVSLDTDSIGFTGYKLYTNPSIGERFINEGIGVGQATGRAVVHGLPQALLAFNEISGYAIQGFWHLPGVASAFAADAVNDWFREISGKPEDEAISLSQERLDAFLNSLQTTAEENREIKEWLYYQAHRHGLVELLGEQYSGNISERVLEEAIPYLITTVLPFVKLGELLALNKTTGIVQRLLHHNSELSKQNLNRINHLMDRRKTGARLSRDENIELRLAKQQQRLFYKKPTGRERRYLQEHADLSLLTKNLGLPVGEIRRILATEYAFEIGSAGALSLTAAVYGENHTLTQLSPIYGGIAAVSSTGVLVTGVHNRWMYGFNFLDYLASSVTRNDNSRTAATIRIAGLEGLAERVMIDKTETLARQILTRDPGITTDVSKLNFSQIRSLMQKRNEEYIKIRKIDPAARTTDQKIRFEQLELEPHLRLDGKDWAQSLDLGELIAIAGHKPSEMKKLAQTARLALQQMEPSQKQALLRRIQEVRSLTGDLNKAIKERGIKYPEGVDGEAIIDLYVEYVMESSAFSELQKDILGQMSHGMRFNVAKNLRLWSRYYKLEKAREQNLTSLKLLAEDILKPIEGERVPDSIKQLKQSIENVLVYAQGQKIDNDNMVNEIFETLTPRMKALLKDKNQRDLMELWFMADDMLRITENSDPIHFRNMIVRMNMLTGEAIERRAQKHNDLYGQLKNSEDWYTAVNVDDTIANMLELANQYGDLYSFENLAGKTPTRISLLKSILSSRQVALYKMMGGNADNTQFADPEKLHELVEGMIKDRDPNVGEGILITGAKKKVVLEQSIWDDILEQIDQVENNAELTADQVLNQQARIYKKFIDDFIYIPSNKIPAEMSLNILNDLRSNLGRLQFAKAHTPQGVRYGELIDIIDDLESSYIQDLTEGSGYLREGAILTPGQARNVEILKQARAAYLTHIRFISRGAGKEATIPGRAGGTKYTIHKEEVLDDFGNIDPDKTSLYNMWSKAFLQPGETIPTADDFRKLFQDDEGNIPIEALQLLLHSVGNHLASGKKLPSTWWKDYKKIVFEGSPMDEVLGIGEFAGKELPPQDAWGKALLEEPKVFGRLQSYGKILKTWEDLNSGIFHFRSTEDSPSNIMGIPKLIELENLQRAWTDGIDQVVDQFKRDLLNIQNFTREVDRWSTIPNLTAILEDPAIDVERIIGLLFGKDPEYHIRRSADGHISIPFKTPGLDEVGTNWTAQLGEEAQDFIKMILGKQAEAKKAGTQYVPVIEDVLRMLTEAENAGKITSSAKANAVDSIKTMFGKFAIQSIWNKTNKKSLVGTRTSAEMIDINELDRFLKEYKGVMDQLYSPEEMDLWEKIGLSLYDIGGQFGLRERTADLPKGLRIDSMLARGFALTREIVSFKWVATEQSIRIYRKNSVRQLEEFFESPNGLEIVQNILEKDPDKITNLDRNKWVAAFSYLIPTGLAKHLTREHLQEKVDEYQKEVEAFKLKYGMPEGWRPTYSEYGLPGLDKTIPNVHQLREEQDRAMIAGKIAQEAEESRRRGATPIRTPEYERQLERRRLGIKFGGKIQRQMDRILQKNG